MRLCCAIKTIQFNFWILVKLCSIFFFSFSRCFNSQHIKHHSIGNHNIMNWHFNSKLKMTLRRESIHLPLLKTARVSQQAPLSVQELKPCGWLQNLQTASRLEYFVKELVCSAMPICLYLVDIYKRKNSYKKFFRLYI